ncbi:alpha-L-glutamate ligase [Alcanivorax sp. P2S70]|uniref:ATP-grasp domain-containing protein n=1 Tax=Alcanivorax TaxID=59753 RepID=UPI0003B3BB55|nr:MULTISPECIES: alpha-L-glutamate ligase [Alcanivorax]ERP90378.1 alpha-L-glutamate ligase [Alcanivorax sp. P2S70]|tara:strand:+ start:977 stop:1780 length:804 start_codon:yes stop_codon:yes gene_type:complete
MPSVKLVTFDPFRTLGLPGVRYIKPEHMQQHREELAAADWLLFPGYWQIHSLHYVLKRRIFPSMSSYHLGHDKVEMTRALQTACPDHIPATLITSADSYGLSQILDQWSFPFVAKSVRSSQGMGVWMIENRQQLYEYAERESVLYVQTLLPIVRDLRIVVVGEEIVASYWREGSGFLNNVSQGGRVRTDLPVPEAALSLVSGLARYLDINHAGFDVAMVDGHPYILEFNRLFGNTGIPDLSTRVSEAMQRYLLGPVASPASDTSVSA